MVTGGVFQCLLLHFLALTWDNQVARDSQLLDTARDCFYFTTKFFEPISISATHIYHSALELCPISSIVRQLYYDRYHGVTRLPRVVIGTPHLWDTAISISGKHGYRSCTWSPCGQFIAARIGQMVEIRNHLTFELLTVLKPSKYIPQAASPLAYSPNGRSIACGFSGGIVIWDVQTGGAAKEINCGCDIVSLVWSLDGRTVAVTLGGRTFTTGVKTYDVFSGTQLFTKRFKSTVNVYLWACEKSFLFVVTRNPHGPKFEVSISEIGPTLIEIESQFTIVCEEDRSWSPLELTFSSSTHHISLLNNPLTIYNIHTSDRLLEERGTYTSIQFSRDGSLFAAMERESLCVWKCTSDRYTLVGKSLLMHEALISSLQFSPTSSSLLSQYDGILQVRRLGDLLIASAPHPQLSAISRSGNSIATVVALTSTVSIIDLHSRVPSQIIDTGFPVTKLAITGNVLVVMGWSGAAGWLLTEEGMVDGVFGDERAGDCDSKWTLPIPQRFNHTRRFSAVNHTRRLSAVNHIWSLSVEGVVGVVRVDCFDKPLLYHNVEPEDIEFVPKPLPSRWTMVRAAQAMYSNQYLLRYHIETGDVLKLSPEPQHPRAISPEISTGGRLHHHLHRPPYLTVLSLKTVG